jgi:transketolase
VITTAETPFEIGKSEIFYRTNAKAEVGIIATGALVHRALLAAKRLETDGLAIKVLNLSTIKPLDEEALTSLARETGTIVTVEEHQIAGGMGSAVSEFLARTYSVPIAFVGVNDRFGQSGEPEELIAHYGMGVDSIVEAVRKIRPKKSSKSFSSRANQDLVNS